MELTVLGSSSKGNCYILGDESEAIIIESGIRPDLIKKGLDFNISKVRGMVISHEHL